MQLQTFREDDFSHICNTHASYLFIELVGTRSLFKNMLLKQTDTDCLSSEAYEILRGSDGR